MHDLRNHLRQTRARMGLSQQDLAQMAGVTRQTISGIESGLYAPSATVALRLAKSLGCRVEDLFWLEGDLPTVEAVPAATVPVGQTARLALARVGARWVAHPLVGDDAFRTELVPADGTGTREAQAASMQVNLLDDPDVLQQTVVLAGCTPAISLWTQAAQRWHPGLRVHWVFANSMAALESLARGEVHMAGMHLYDQETGEHNAPFVRRVLHGRGAVLINLGVWEEGLLVRRGNPLGLHGVSDLARPQVSMVNREPGSGARHLLERLLLAAQIPPAAVQGFGRVVHNHLEVARAVAAGLADAGVSAAPVAAAFGLGFVPLHRVRYDLAVLKDALTETPVRQLLGTLHHRRVRSQLETLGGFDTAETGEVMAEIN